MDPRDFESSPAGRVMKTPQGHYAFVPNPLPPLLPFDNKIVGLLSEAERALGNLVGVGNMLPNPELLIRPFTRREAVLSSRIEGTQASLTELVEYEAAQLPVRGLAVDSDARSDVQEVHNYRVALQYGLDRLRDLPLSLRFTRELHQRLMEGVRGKEKRPGEFRNEQNWIGPPGSPIEEATFVPPAVPEMHEALDSWEKYLHIGDDLPLIQCALIHYQFETIHPFVDGNGRVGRLLIPLYLAEKGLLPKPLLYLSAYFEANRRAYHDLLYAVSQRGAWSEWIAFFLRGVAEQALDGVSRSQRILALRDVYRDRFLGIRASALRLQLIDLLFERPVTTAFLVGLNLKISQVSAGRVLDDLQKQGIIREVTGYRRNRVFIAEELLQLVEEDA